MQQQSAAPEQRQAHHRFRQAYVNAQLAKQWTAGQPWAELDATAVPWCAKAAAAAEHKWREVTFHLPCDIARQGHCWQHAITKRHTEPLYRGLE